MRGPPTIFNRLLTLALAVALPCVGLIGFALYRQVRNDRAAALHDIVFLRQVNQRAVAERIDAARRHLTRLALEPCVLEMRDNECFSLFREFVAGHPEYANLALLDHTGLVVATVRFTPPDPNQSLATLPRYRTAMETPGFHLSHPYIGNQSRQWTCLLSQPVTSPDGTRLGTLVIPLNLPNLAEHLILPANDAGMSVGLLDSDGIILARQPDSAAHIGKAWPDYQRLRDSFAQSRDSGLAVNSLDGTPRIVTAEEVPGTRWIVTASVPQAHINQLGMEKFWRALGAVSLILAVAATLVVRYARALSRPITELATVARTHATGRTDLPAPISGPAEIADTARAFNEMNEARRRTEEILRESELRYRTVIDQTGQMVYDLDLANRSIRWFGTEAIPAITGRTLAEFSTVNGNRWQELIHPDDRAATLATFAEARRTGRPFHAEYRFQHQDGSYRLLEDHGVFQCDAAGEPVRLLGRMSDISERRSAELALLESERRYQAVIEQTGQMIYDLDVPSGTVRWFGLTGINRITGLTPEELGREGVEGWAALLHPDDRSVAVDRLRRCLATGAPCQAQYRLRHKDGSYHVVDEQGVVLLDSAGRARRMLGRMSDVTERERIAGEIRQRQNLLRQIIDLVPHFIFAKDTEGRFLLANQALARAFNTTVDEILGKSDADFNPNAEEVAHFRAADREVIESRQMKLIAEENITDAAGVVHILSTVKIPFMFPAPEGERPALLGVAVDITDLKRAEDARKQMETKLLETQKLESLGLLAGGIAHDFNNLLTGILGNAGLARLEAPAGWPGLDPIHGIEKAALRAADLCKQMLAYSGKGRFVVQRLDLNELLTDTTQLLQISINKKAALRYNLSPALPSILADASQIRQVVMNLVINASEALGERAGTITLSTGLCQVDATYLAETLPTAALPPGEYVFLEVGDDGAGMTRETVARIFDPFFTTKFTGRGLGLAAVLGIVRGHKGGIKVYSEPGRGTTFKLLFPATTGSAESLNRAAAPTFEWRGQGRVLVVDDEESVRSVSARLLQRLGFTVDTAVDGEDALARFRPDPHAFRLVMLDLTMPRLDGEETFRQLRQLNPAVRVVLMSGFNRVDAINRFTGRGLAGFVQKPFEVDTLTNEVRRVLEDVKR